MKKGGGFTLLELMIVVIVIGILAGFAIPSYIRITERTKGDKAVTLLRLIRTGEKMYSLDYNAFTSDLDDLAPYILVGDLDSDPDWDYADPVLDGEGFDATAVRSAGPYGPGGTGGTISIDQDGVITSANWPFHP